MLKDTWWLIMTCAALCLGTQSCQTLCDPMDCSLPGSSVHGDSPGKNTGRVGCHSLLHGIFPTQGLNLVLPHCRQILYWLSHQEKSNHDLLVGLAIINNQVKITIILIPIFTLIQGIKIHYILSSSTYVLYLHLAPWLNFHVESKIYTPIKYFDFG